MSRAERPPLHTETRPRIFSGLRARRESRTSPGRLIAAGGIAASGAIILVAASGIDFTNNNRGSELPVIGSPLTSAPSQPENVITIPETTSRGDRDTNADQNRTETPQVIIVPGAPETVIVPGPTVTVFLSTTSTETAPPTSSVVHTPSSTQETTTTIPQTSSTTERTTVPPTLTTTIPPTTTTEVPSQAEDEASVTTTPPATPTTVSSGG